MEALLQEFTAVIAVCIVIFILVWLRRHVYISRYLHYLEDLAMEAETLDELVKMEELLIYCRPRLKNHLHFKRWWMLMLHIKQRMNEQ